MIQVLYVYRKASGLTHAYSIQTLDLLMHKHSNAPFFLLLFPPDGTGLTVAFIARFAVLCEAVISHHADRVLPDGFHQLADNFKRKWF
jgi:hypothetical protein